MAPYISSPTSTSHRFSQAYPLSSCKNEVWNIIESLHKGYEVKCRDARCSFACNARWSYRHWTCVHKLLHEHVGDEYAIYRGHLRLPADAAPEVHRRVRKEFLRILDRWRTRNIYTLEVHAVLDIDDPINAHWDTVGYSNAPRRPLKMAMSDAWRRAGGLKQTLVPVDDDELVGTLKYQVKDTTRADRARRFLPASRAEMGMNHHWSTKGFWSGKSEAEMWNELKDEWFGPGSNTTETCPIVDMKSRTTFRDRMVSRLRSLTPEADAYLKVFPWHDSIAGSGQDNCITTA
jgi:hypothetical protein